MPDQNIASDTQEESLETTVQTEDQSAILLSLGELIKTNISTINRIGEELRKMREMFDDAFGNDPAFREQSEKVKEANKIKSEIKKRILQQPSLVQLSNKIKEAKLEIKERELSLSDYLKEYQRMSGANEIEYEGEVLEIVSTAKLARRGIKKE